MRRSILCCPTEITFGVTTDGDGGPNYTILKTHAPIRSSAAEDTYLIGKIDDAGERTPNPPRDPYDPKAGISASTLYDQLKRFFFESSQALEITGPTGCRPDCPRQHRTGSAILFCSHAASPSHTPLEVVQGVMGHVEPDIPTTIYVKALRPSAVAGSKR
jgi:hypothetical protein